MNSSIVMSKPKQVTASIKLLINAGQAKPSPPVGPALGQAGLNIMSFCKDFNAKTAIYKVYTFRFSEKMLTFIFLSVWQGWPVLKRFDTSPDAGGRPDSRCYNGVQRQEL